jgi:hypothetical protein
MNSVTDNGNQRTNAAQCSKEEAGKEAMAMKQPHYRYQTQEEDCQNQIYFHSKHDRFSPSIEVMHMSFC